MISTTWVKRLAIAAFWLAAWQLAAWTAGNSLLLCGPLEALEALAALLPQAAFWESLGCSLGRIAAGFLAAAALGCLLGAGARAWPLVGDLISPLMSVVKGAPVVCIIVLLLVLLGSSQTTIVAVALVVAPPFYAAVREAAAVRDPGLDEMLQVFGVGCARRLAAVRWPQAAPFLRAAAGTAAAMAWKAGVAAELLGLPASSIGEQVYLAKLTLDTPGIVAWTAVAVLMGWLSEKLVMALLGALENAPRRWLAHRVRRAQALGDEAGIASPVERGRVICPKPDDAGQAVADSCIRGVGAPTRPADADAAALPAPIGLSFCDISKGFGDHRVLEHFSLDLAPGRRTALMAPSGAGKTTALRLALGLEAPDGGAVERTAGPLAAVFQEPRLLEDLTAAENLALVAADPGELRYGLQLLDELLEAPESAAKPVCRLSGGMRRRAELARALARPSGLLALDEPFTGLDDETRRRTAAIAARCLQGRTLLLATHEAADAEALQAPITPLA